MAIRKIVLAIAVGAVAAALRADSTADLVNAEHVQRRLYLQVSHGILEYAIDDSDFQELEKDQVFAIERSFKLAFRSLNPLKYRVTVNAIESPDPSFAAVADFLAKLVQFRAVLDAARAATPEAPASRGLPPEGEEEKERKRPSAGPIPACPKEFEDFRTNLIATAAGIVHDDAPAATEVANWVKHAEGQKGIIEQRKLILGAAEAIGNNLKRDRDGLDRLLSPLDPVTAQNTPARIRELLSRKELHCPDNDVYTLSALVAIGDRADNLLRAKAALASALEALAKVLEKYETGWLPLPDCSGECYGTDYELLSVKGDPSKARAVTVSVSRVVISAGDLSVSVEPASLTHTFTLRRYRSLIPEGAAGMIYSGLRRPRFGTAMADGHLVVRSAGSEPPDYSAAALLNGVFNVWKGIHPMIQLGVSYTKDAPALLIGGGLRITQAKGLGLAGGLLIGWVEDLDKLELESPVNGTQDIEKDLKLKQRFSHYLALQYSF